VSGTNNRFLVPDTFVSPDKAALAFQQYVNELFEND
jgi:hypothetical protein